MQKCSCAQTCCRQSQKSAWISCALFSPLRLKATSSGSVVLQPLLGKWDCAGCLYIERVGRRDWQQRADPAALHSGCFSGCPPATRLVCQSGLHPNITLVYSCHGIGLQWGIYGEMGMGQCLFPSLGHQVALCPFIMWVQDMQDSHNKDCIRTLKSLWGKKVHWVKCSHFWLCLLAAACAFLAQRSAGAAQEPLVPIQLQLVVPTLPLVWMTQRWRGADTQQRLCTCRGAVRGIWPPIAHCSCSTGALPPHADLACHIPCCMKVLGSRIYLHLYKSALPPKKENNECLH